MRCQPRMTTASGRLGKSPSGSGSSRAAARSCACEAGDMRRPRRRTGRRIATSPVAIGVPPARSPLFWDHRIAARDRCSVKRAVIHRRSNEHSTTISGTPGAGDISNTFAEYSTRALISRADIPGADEHRPEASCRGDVWYLPCCHSRQDGRQRKSRRAVARHYKRAGERP